MSALRRRRMPPFAVDVLVAVVAAAAGSAREIASPNFGTKYIVAPVWVYVVAQLLAAATLLARRHRPYAAALTVAGITVFVPAWAGLLIPYAVTAYGPDRRRAWAVVGVLTACWLVGVHAWAIDDPFSGPAVILISALLGLYVRARRRLVAELVDRIRRAERERSLLAEQARADERIRLAAEMHDVVTHRINLMVLQAGALRMSTTDPGIRSAAEDLRTAGCQALSELRDLVGVLRNGEAPGPRAGPAEPALDGGTDLATLVGDSRAVGLPVRLDENGDPGMVTPTVRRTLYRIVQESLTNVHKHAPGSRATVAVEYGPDGVHATVSNTSPSRRPDTDLAGAGGGSGLAGLRHRVEVLGGTLSAGSTSDGGFLVRATLPAFVATTARR